MSITAVSNEIDVPASQQDAPHLAYPLAFTTTGAVTVGQDTPAELVGCVQAICDCPVGFRDDFPGFGIPQLAFSTYPPKTAQVVAAIGQFEPRATITEVTVNPIQGQGNVTVTLQIQGANG